MSPAEQPLNPSQATDQSIETIYTTVEVQRDRTDWLTVVSNLRQINRQLVEEIARLEEALASAKQTSHSHKEANQNHEITILQQQDELRIAHDRIGALFQQLETSHQIGQRQQTLIETLSQQLEIVQTIIPQIEAEHEQLRQKYQQQSQKLIKTERVAIELHRRLKLQTHPASQATTTTPAPAATTTAVTEISSDPASTETVSIFDPTSSETIAAAQLRYERDEDDLLAATIAITPESPLEPTSSDSTISTAQIDPAPPLAPLELPLQDSNRTPSIPTLAQTTILASSTPSARTSWREAVASDNLANRYSPNLDPVSSSTPSSSETVNKESTTLTDSIATSSPNWPAPTLNRARSIAKTVKIDLPKFPKKVDS
jgi:murein L,D-transpeptidase YcbB/YkuD